MQPDIRQRARGELDRVVDFRRGCPQFLFFGQQDHRDRSTAGIEVLQSLQGFLLLGFGHGEFGHQQVRAFSGQVQQGFGDRIDKLQGDREVVQRALLLQVLKCFRRFDGDQDFGERARAARWTAVHARLRLVVVDGLQRDAAMATTGLPALKLVLVDQ